MKVEGDRGPRVQRRGLRERLVVECADEGDAQHCLAQLAFRFPLLSVNYVQSTDSSQVLSVKFFQSNTCSQPHPAFSESTHFSHPPPAVSHR